MKIIPGANSIEFDATDLKPPVPGYITRFTPNLERADGSIPPVDELHLHHAVWLMRNYPTFAAGEEKTIFQLPQGFGYKYDPKDPWIVNHMIHNLLPNQDSAYVTYEIDFVPLDRARRAGHEGGQAAVARRRRPQARIPSSTSSAQWGGSDGKYTFPDDARRAEERAKIGGSPQRRSTGR